jgi:hypothetical protein
VQFGNVHFLFSAEVFSIFPIVASLNHQKNMKGPALQGLSLALIYDGLLWNYACRTGSFFTLAHRVLNLLPFVQVRIPLCLDFRVVNEQVGSTVVSDDKTVSFSAIEPFHCSCTQNNTPWPFSWPSIYTMPLTFVVGGYP